jgi:chemotaxis-related protein WspD
MDQKNDHLPAHCWKKTGVFGDGSCEKLAAAVHCRNCREYAQAGRSLFDREISQGYREEWTELLASAKEAEATGTVSVVIYRINSEWLALKTGFFREVVELRPVHTIPFRTGAVFKGLVNINGELLLCVSAAAMLGLEEAAEEHTTDSGIYKRLAVVARDGERFVFPVDEIAGILHLSGDEVQKTPATIAKDPAAHVLGVFTFRDNTVGLLDEDKFFQSLLRSVAS